MKRYLVFVFLITALFFSINNVSFAQTSNTNLFIKSKQLSMDGNFEEAAKLLEIILQSEKSMYIYDMLIENQLNANMIDKALNTSKQAATDFPKEAKYLYLISNIYKAYKNDIKTAYDYMEQCLKLKYTPEYATDTAILAGVNKNFNRAEKLLDKVIKDNPTNSQYYTYRAEIYLMQNKGKKAIKDLNKAIEIDNNVTARLMLAEIYIAEKNEDKAVAILEDVAKDNENISSIIEQNIGKIYRDNGNFDKAIEVYKRLSQKLYGSQKATILIQLGDVLNMAGKHAEAGAVFEEVTTLVPNNTSYYLISGKFYEYVKNYKKAEELYKNALKIDPLYAQVLKRLTVVYLLQDNTKDALTYINMVDIVEQDVDYYLLKAECYSLDKKYKEAIPVLEEGVKHNPTNANILAMLASIYEETGNQKEALKYIEKAVKIEPNNHIYQNFLGFLYAEMDIKLNDALKLVEKALSQEPDNAAYLDSLGWVYYKMKDYKKAYKYIIKAVELMPDEKELQDHLTAVKKAMDK